MSVKAAGFAALEGQFVCEAAEQEHQGCGGCSFLRGPEQVLQRLVLLSLSPGLSPLPSCSGTRGVAPEQSTDLFHGALEEKVISYPSSHCYSQGQHQIFD